MENIFKIENDERNFWLRPLGVAPFHVLPQCSAQSEIDVVDQLKLATQTVESWNAREIDQQDLFVILAQHQIDEVLHNLTSNCAASSSVQIRCIYTDGTEYSVTITNDVVSQCLAVTDFIKFMHARRPFVAIAIVLSWMNPRTTDAWRAAGLSAVTPAAAHIYGGLVGLG